ncbi:diphthamide synthesis protein [Candidatus Woesearchaeota archaeon]|nr:diphthamide synthesis protein [Candidatus Woesearchaeota archaeon]
MEIKEIQGVKTIFIPAKVKDIDLSILKKLKIKEKRIGLVSAVQYVDYLEEVKKILEKNNYKVEIAGQMVGCNSSKAIKLKDKVDCFVFFGSGEFHPLELVNTTGIKKIYIVNPVSKTVSKFSEEELDKLTKKRQALIKKYLMADRIGVLVSTKPGQNALKAALKFAKTCGKEAYVFMADEIDINGLENFNDIKIWVNTACPRIESNNIISLKDVMGNSLVNYHTY